MPKFAAALLVSHILRIHGKGLAHRIRRIFRLNRMNAWSLLWWGRRQGKAGTVGEDDSSRTSVTTPED